MTTALALRSQFSGCRFVSRSYGWFDKKTRILIFFADIGKPMDPVVLRMALASFSFPETGNG